MPSGAASSKYLDTLRDLGASPSTKYIFPLEFTGLVQRFVDAKGKKAVKTPDRSRQWCSV